jgi:hypothetical protein
VRPDPTGGAKLAPDVLREDEVRGVVAVEMAELASPERECQLSPAPHAGADAGPRGDPLDDRPRTWESVGRSRRLDAETYGRVTAIAGGARLTMRMELRLHGLPRFMLPLLARYMHRQQARNLGSIKALLER